MQGPLLVQMMAEGVPRLAEGKLAVALAAQAQCSLAMVAPFPVRLEAQPAFREQSQDTWMVPTSGTSTSWTDVVPLPPAIAVRCQPLRYQRQRRCPRTVPACCWVLQPQQAASLIRCYQPPLCCWSRPAGVVRLEELCQAWAGAA